MKDYKVSELDKFIAVVFTLLAVVVYLVLSPFLPLTALIISFLIFTIPLDIFYKWFDNYFGSHL